jgi:hypothetical protein
MNRRLFVSLSLALVLLALFATVSFAQGTGTKQVGLVIGLPDNKMHVEIVTVPADATAFDTLQKANIQLVSASTQFGPAVCSIDGVGATSADSCFADTAHFWAYYHLDAGNKTWTVSQDGVGNYKPADGAVEGFVYSGMDANFNPTEQPPVVTFDQIKAQAGGPAVIPAPANAHAASAAPAAAAPTAVAPTAAPTTAAPSVLPTSGGESLPVWGLVAAGLLCVAAGLLARRKLA